MCSACPFVQEGKHIKEHNVIWNISKSLNCESQNVVYMIECDKPNCKQKYIGQTERQMKKRFDEHRRYVENNIISQATGYHFNQRGHSINNMKITIIEKVKQTNENYRKERERFFINKFNTFHKEINKMP